MDKHDIPFLGDFYTKSEVDAMVAAAVDEARAIDEASMAEHNFKATIISMILGFICLALFLDGTLRLLGIIPPFLDIDISIVDKIAEKVAEWGAQYMGKNGWSNIGAVIGATRPQELKHFRKLMPQTPFLLPGFGFQ